MLHAPVDLRGLRIPEDGAIALKTVRPARDVSAVRGGIARAPAPGYAVGSPTALQLRAGGSVPEPDGPVVRGGEDPRASGRETHGAQRPLMPLEGADQAPLLEVPQMDADIGMEATRGGDVAIGGNGRRGHKTEVARELGQELARPGVAPRADVVETDEQVPAVERP